MVMQACTPLDAAQRIPGVQPGARLLLHAEGEQSVRAVLERIDAIEALGIAPAAARPRTGARSPTGSLRACRCPNTPPSGTPPGWPGGRCHDRRFDYRHRAASSLARVCALASCWRACPPAASLRWPGRPSCIRCRA
jgi:hypothetical protein